jgi:DNA mismatch endonuclease (patch repair protein)
MSHIKCSETKPEICVRKYLFSQGFRYRKNDKRYPGTPDIILSKYNTAIFVNGCFWHGHDCKFAKKPKSNSEYWKNKIIENKNRDRRNYTLLLEAKWNVIIIWECEINTLEKRTHTLNKLIYELKQNY